MAANQEPGRLAAAAALLVAARSATLATVFEGAPHASLVTPALAEDGQPVLLLSELAVHTRHLRANPVCALLVAGAAQGENPQTTPRLCLNGIAQPVEGQEMAARFLEIHPYATQYAGFGDFSFWKITVSTAQYIGGFANAGYLDFSALQQEISAHLRRGYS
jgi:heme iron utilization protein